MPPKSKPNVDTSARGTAKAQAVVIIHEAKETRKKKKPVKRRKAVPKEMPPRQMGYTGQMMPSISIINQPPQAPPAPSLASYMDIMSMMRQQPPQDGWGKGIQLTGSIPTLGEVSGVVKDVAGLVKQPTGAIVEAIQRPPVVTDTLGEIARQVIAQPGEPERAPSAIAPPSTIGTETAMQWASPPTQAPSTIGTETAMQWASQPTPTPSTIGTQRVEEWIMNTPPPPPPFTETQTQLLPDFMRTPQPSAVPSVYTPPAQPAPLQPPPLELPPALRLPRLPRLSQSLSGFSEEHPYVGAVTPSEASMAIQELINQPTAPVQFIETISNYPNPEQSSLGAIRTVVPTASRIGQVGQVVQQSLSKIGSTPFAPRMRR